MGGQQVPRRTLRPAGGIVGAEGVVAKGRGKEGDRACSCSLPRRQLPRGAGKYNCPDKVPVSLNTATYRTNKNNIRR